MVEKFVYVNLVLMAIHVTILFKDTVTIFNDWAFTAGLITALAMPTFYSIFAYHFWKINNQFAQFFKEIGRYDFTFKTNRVLLVFFLMTGTN